jgi:hypothetical protein
MWALGVPAMIALLAFLAFAGPLGIVGAAVGVLLVWLVIGFVVWAGKRGSS